jgi:hypothetical protein
MAAQKITLKKPIQAHGEEISELTINEPTIGALEGVELTISFEGTVKIDLAAIPKLIAASADIPPSAAKQIGFSDLPAMVEVVMGFIGGSLEIGGSS